MFGLISVNTEFEIFPSSNYSRDRSNNMFSSITISVQPGIIFYLVGGLIYKLYNIGPIA
jgi:hypothetical protein